jgi:uncharacterized protein YqcC (DUF446 family)
MAIVTEIRCGGGVHEVEVDRGGLTIFDFDYDEEAVLVEMGYSGSPCYQAINFYPTKPLYVLMMLQRGLWATEDYGVGILPYEAWVQLGIDYVHHIDWVFSERGQQQHFEMFAEAEHPWFYSAVRAVEGSLEGRFTTMMLDKVRKNLRDQGLYVGHPPAAYHANKSAVQLINAAEWLVAISLPKVRAKAEKNFFKYIFEVSSQAQEAVRNKAIQENEDPDKAEMEEKKWQLDHTLDFIERYHEETSP